MTRPSMALICAHIVAEWPNDGGERVTVAEVRGPSLAGRAVRPRQAFMHRAREAGFSLTQIGNFLGRDHTTIIHGSRRHAERTGALAL